jgi:DNA-binding NarL/FixJ family response regulator
MNSEGMEHIAIVDDRLRDVELIAQAVHRISGRFTIQKYTQPMAFFESLVETQQTPDIILTDCQMPEMDGMALSHLVKLFVPSIKIIMISGLITETDIAELMDMGVDAVVAKGSLKIAQNTSLEMALEAVRANKVFIDPLWDEALVQKIFIRLNKNKDNQNIPIFSKSEQKIIQLLATHHQYKSIAEFLHLSPRTIETHVKKIAEKTHSENKTGIITYGIKHFLIRIFRG